MNFKNTTEALYIQTKEILDTLAKIETSDELHIIELDLMLEKLRNIYDLVNDMKETLSKKNNSGIYESSGSSNVKDLNPEPGTTGSGTNTIEEEKPVAKEKSNEVEKPERTANISERFKTSKPTLNEEMEGFSKRKNLSSQLNLTPINSISGAIGLNEKFELINELFSGDKDKFESTLEVLNNADSFVEAYNYLNDNFDWDMDSVYVQRVLELIRRKLIVRRNEQ